MYLKVSEKSRDFSSGGPLGLVRRFLVSHVKMSYQNILTKESVSMAQLLVLLLKGLSCCSVKIGLWSVVSPGNVKEFCLS